MIYLTIKLDNSKINVTMIYQEMIQRFKEWNVAILTEEEFQLLIDSLFTAVNIEDDGESILIDKLQGLRNDN